MYVVIRLPAFSLQAVLAQKDVPVQEAAVLVGVEGRRVVVREMNRAARQAAIEEGFTVAQARARLPAVGVYEVNAMAEATAARTLLGVARNLTPRVEESAPGEVTLDTRGMRERRPEALARHIRALLKRAGYFACVGAAATPDLAAIAARVQAPGAIVRDARAFLEEVPLSAAGLSPNLRERLHDWGIRTLGALLQLPRPAVVERLGDEAGEVWERLAGQRARPLRLAPDAPSFRENVEWENPVDTLEPLLFLLRRLLDQLALQIRGAGHYAGAVQLTLREAMGDGHQRRFALPEPTQSGALLFRVIDLHLQQVRLESGLTGLALELEAVDPPHRQRSLFQTGVKDPWRLSDTLAKLRGLVGEKRVGVPRLRDSHRPDSLTLEAPAEEIPAAVAEEQAAYGPALRRRRTSDTNVRVHLRHDIPAFLETEGARWSIVAAAGPYPLSGDWWEPNRAWAHTEWDVELTDGRLCRLAHEGPHWRIEGFYD